MLPEERVVAVCRTQGAQLHVERDGRVFLCNRDGRDIGRVDPGVFEALTAQGRMLPVRDGVFELDEHRE